MTVEFGPLYSLVFISAALGLILLERVRALQRQSVHVEKRWTSNVGLLIIGSVVSSVVLPIGIYAFAQQRPPGMLSHPDIPFVLQVAGAFLLLDLWKYWEHRAFHKVPLLWRLHLVHHSDTEVDVTTTERHHPLEVLLSTALLTGLVAVLGLPALALGIYLIAATVVALYSHANLNVPPSFDRPMRWVIVTAPLHAIHHSDLRMQTDSNFGAVLTIWDRLFGTYADPERTRIPHFGLAYFHLANDTRIARVLLQPFLFRSNFAYPARARSDADSASAAKSAAWPVDARVALLAGAFGCALMTLAMWPAVATMMATWRDSEAYQFAWLVAPMVVYVVGWHIRPPVDVRPDFTGTWVMALAVACWIAASLMNIDVGRQFAFVLALQGIAMSTFGGHSSRRLFPALALLFLMIPSGDLLEPGLRLLTLRSIEAFATFAGLPHSVDGFVIFIGAQRYIVIDDCSGLTYVTLASFLGYSFGLLVYRSFFRVVAMGLLGAVVGIGINVLRVSSIVLIDWLRGTQMDLAAHGAFQWIALIAGLGILFFVLQRLPAETTAEAPTPSTPIAVPPSRKLAPLFVGLVALPCTFGLARLQHDARHPGDEIDARSFPRTLAGWQKDDRRTVHRVDPDGRLETLRTTYVRDGRDIEAVKMVTLSHDAKLPESRLAPEDRTLWRERQIDHATGCADSHCIAFMHATWERGRGEQVRHVYFAYAIGSFVTESRFAIRAAHGWDRLTGDPSRPQLIGFISDDALGPAELAAAFRNMLAASRVPPSPENS